MTMTNVQQRPGWLTCIIVAITVCVAAGAPAEDIGPRAGSLVLIGGGRPLPDDALKRFVELAGGPDAPIVIIPTAGGAPAYDDSFIGVADLRRAGARNLRILHTYDRTEADSATFIAPLRTARGVFIYGGTNAILVDAYVNTNTLREIRSLLDRGGVVGGTSAGAEVQGSFMPRGQTGDSDGKVLIGDHQVGFGFLNHVAVDAHVLAKNRQFDMLEITGQHPELLGIGLDEQAAIVVRDGEFEVLGESYVLIYDNDRVVPPSGPFYFLRPGDRFNLQTREATRPAANRRVPIDRVQPKTRTIR